MQPIGQHVLEDIGAWDSVKSNGRYITRITGVEAKTQRRVLDVHYPTTQQGLGIHRGALFDALWKSATNAGVTLKSGHKIIGTQDRYVYLSNGTQGPFDLIVDASGVNSPLSPLKAVTLPYGALWACVDWTGTLKQNALQQRYRRANKMLGVLPIGTLPGETQQKAAIFWSLPTLKVSHVQLK